MRRRFDNFEDIWLQSGTRARASWHNSISKPPVLLVVAEYPRVMRIMLTGQATAETAIRAVNEGKVYHFFTKPCDEVKLALTIRKALEEKDRLEEDHALPDSPQASHTQASI